MPGGRHQQPKPRSWMSSPPWKFLPPPLFLSDLPTRRKDPGNPRWAAGPWCGLCVATPKVHVASLRSPCIWTATLPRRWTLAETPRGVSESSARRSSRSRQETPTSPTRGSQPPNSANPWKIAISPKKSRLESPAKRLAENALRQTSPQPAMKLKRLDWVRNSVKSFRATKWTVLEESETTNSEHALFPCPGG